MRQLTPKEYGPPKYPLEALEYHGQNAIGSNTPMMRRFFARMMDGLASEAAVLNAVMIDAAHLKAHRTAISLRSKKPGLATTKAV